jgi:short-subunit dehydrogenase
MGSGSSYYGTPEFNTYGAAKAGVLNLAQALRIEVENSGVHVAVVNPLFVKSPMLDERNRRARYVRRFGMTHTPEQVARSIVRGIERRQFLIFPSLRPRINYLLTRQLHWLAHPIMRFFWR